MTDAGGPVEAATVVSTGFAYPEGPCFDATGVLYTVELAGGVVSRTIDGQREVWVRPGGAPNGAAFGADGTLYFCNNGGNWGPNASTGMIAGLGGQPALIQSVDPAGVIRTVADSCDGRALNGPNDLVLDGLGGIWFTDPAWAPRDPAGSAPASASPPGAVRYVGADRVVTTVRNGLVFPNGIAITPEGDRLVVGETGTGDILVADLIAPGHVGDWSVYARLGEQSFPDGMCFDARGRLIVAGTGSGRLFVVGALGDVEREIPMDDRDLTNVCFGGPGFRTLFVTQAETGRVVSIAWDCPGSPLAVQPLR